MTQPPGSQARVVGSDDGQVLPLIGVLKASAEQTMGRFEIIDYTGPAAPPPHIHREHEEAFYVLRGTFMFTLDHEVFAAAEGSTVLVPRGTRHGFTADSGSRALLIIVPGGLQGFFKELSAGLASGQTSEDIRKALAGRYDSIPAD